MGCGTEFWALHIHNLQDCALYCVLSVIGYYVFFAVKKVCLCSFRVKFGNWYSIVSQYFATEPTSTRSNYREAGGIWPVECRENLTSVYVEELRAFIASDEVNLGTGSIVNLRRSVSEIN
jgi:hypothetical protein